MAKDESRSSSKRTSSHAAATVVVGIGASAGGLEAIQEFFDNAEPDSGAAFVVVQHLSPDFKSLMDEILRRHTGMQVVKVEGRVDLAPNSIYLLPPRSNIVVENGNLNLEEQPATTVTVPRPIDEFLCSLARERKDAAIALVLSGTGSDGARGVRAVKDAGGTVLVQEPETARFDGMPRAAIATGCTDFVLPPAELAERVGALLRHPFLHRAAMGFAETPANKEPYEAILDVLKERLDCDLTAYKPGTLVRRIERRMSLHHMRDPAAYLEMLRRDDSEVARLASDCLINVTQFFRDPEAFRALRRALIERLSETRDQDGPFRVWVAGCASGEEAYTVAVLIDSTLRELDCKREFKIFATDIAAQVLESASTARYPASVLEEIPPPFAAGIGSVGEKHELKIAPQLRNRIVFARHDVLRDPPFPRADLITCRNLLIYLKPEAQRAALERFCFALVPDGILFLGASESVEQFGDGFDSVDARARIYSRRAGSRAIPGFRGSSTHLRLLPDSFGPGRSTPPAFPESAITRAVESMIDLLATAGAIVDDAGRVVYSFGDIGRWLQVPRGRVSTDLFEMLPANTVDATRWAIRQARGSSEVVRIGSLEIDGSNCSLELLHVGATASDDKDEQLPGLDVLLLRSQEQDARAAAGSRSDEIDLDEAVRGQIDALETDLRSTRESLQTTIEELETSNEELQATNEELLASNEELQSTNEELHSVNEELYTVNAEHEQKISELLEVTADLEHLLNNTEIGTIFLDSAMRVRRFTPSAQIALPLRDQDPGRRITELQSHLVDTDLGSLAKSVLDSGEAVEQQVSTEQGVHIHLRVHPYRVGANIAGVVVTFVDMSRIEEAQRATREQARILRSIEETSRDVFWSVDAESLRLGYLSPSFERVWGQPVDDRLQESRGWPGSIHPDDRQRVEREYLSSARTGEYAAEYRIVRADGEVRWIADRAHGVIEDGGRRLIIGSAEDVTSRVQLDQEHRRGLEIHLRACDHALVPMLLVELDGTVLWGNGAVRRKLRGRQQAIPERVEELLLDADDQQAWKQALESAVEAGSATAQVALTFEEGQDTPCEIELVYVNESEHLPGFFVCQWVDETERRVRESELETRAADLEWEADRDPLTELLNRRGLERVLVREFHVGARRGDTFVAILVDCDEFKTINDRFGLPAGDTTLREVARRLRESLRPTDLLARVGGDEFLVVLPSARLAEGAHVGEKLRRAITAKPIAHMGHEIEATVSVGVVAASPSSRPEDLVAQADGLLKRSKHAGRNRVTFADPDDSATGFASLETLLGASPAESLRVVARGVHDVASRERIGVELVARGSDAAATTSRVFQAAAQAGRLEEIDLLALEACVERAIRLAGAPHVHLNIFPITLLSSSPARVDRLLERIAGGGRCCVALSERHFVGEPAKLRARIDRLRDRGIRIGVDDVGLGRTSLETLLALEPDVVKVDGRLVADVDGSAASRRILERLVAMLQHTDIELIARGVERESQRRVLEEAGVRLAQGLLWPPSRDIEASFRSASNDS